MDFTLEVVVIPVSDVERAAQFSKSFGWRLDADIASEGCRPTGRPTAPTTW